MRRRFWNGCADSTSLALITLSLRSGYDDALIDSCHGSLDDLVSLRNLLLPRPSAR
jgi:hypothetical protein